MAGKVIHALRASPLGTFLSEAELRLLSNCGRVLDFYPTQSILDAGSMDERIFVLRQGQVNLQLTMWSEGGKCGGESTFLLDAIGEIFGWASWFRPDRITIEAQALDPVSVVALDLNRLGDSQVFLKISQWMTQSLYQRLQECGLCPPNVKGLLKLRQAYLV